MVREVFLGEAIFELGPEGTGAVGLTQRREDVPAQMPLSMEFHNRTPQGYWGQGEKQKEA